MNHGESEKPEADKSNTTRSQITSQTKNRADEPTVAREPQKPVIEYGENIMNYEKNLQSRQQA